MLKRYQIVSNCLSDVRKADLRTIDRLQLEVALYRLKLVLLAEQETLDDDVEPEFANVVEMGRHICSPGRTSIEIQKFIIHLNEVKEKILIRSGGDRPHQADARAR